VTAGGEAAHVADEGDEGGGGQQSDAWDAEQGDDGGQLLGKGLELTLDLLDASLDLADRLAGGSEERAQGFGQLGAAAT